ncbi:type II secretion system protein [Candidatus Saccharibacteria bacterium]|nr:type II secretion system protein [Candidatus Saccharibacteria bacterium]
MVRRKSGFTMIETTLAMAFISVLMLLVAILIMQISSIYTKTLTLQSVNNAGSSIIEDMKRSINASLMVMDNSKCSAVQDAYKNTCKEDKAYLYIYQQYETNMLRDDRKSLPTSGVFCTGYYTYIWNSGYVLFNPSATPYRAKIVYSYNGGGKTISDFRLVRFLDINGKACEGKVSNTYSPSTGADNVWYNLGAVADEPAELLDNSEVQLSLYDMKIFRPATHPLSGQAYYAGTFILGTGQGDLDIRANGDFCKSPPQGHVTEFDYCAINKFNFAAQAIGEDND